MRPRPRSTVRATCPGAISIRDSRPPGRSVARMTAGLPAGGRNDVLAPFDRSLANNPEIGPSAAACPPAVIARRFGFTARPIRSPATLPGNLVGGKDRALAADPQWRARRAHDHA